MAKKKPRGEELRRRTLNLTCRLTADELEERRESLVEWTNMRAARELDLARWLGEMKEQKKLYEGEVTTAGAHAERLARVIKNREEYRDVEVVDFIDGTTVTTFRSDTGEIVGERPADDTELQKKLNIPDDNLDPSGDPIVLEGAAEPECSCNPETPGVHKIDCPVHGVMGDE